MPFDPSMKEVEILYMDFFLMGKQFLKKESLTYKHKATQIFMSFQTKIKLLLPKTQYLFVNLI